MTTSKEGIVLHVARDKCFPPDFLIDFSKVLLPLLPLGAQSRICRGSSISQDGNCICAVARRFVCFPILQDGATQSPKYFVHIQLSCNRNYVFVESVFSHSEHTHKNGFFLKLIFCLRGDTFVK